MYQPYGLRSARLSKPEPGFRRSSCCISSVSADLHLDGRCWELPAFCLRRSPGGSMSSL